MSVSNKSYTVGDLLALVLKNTHSESEWLNHLSQLEYVGCRKILKAVPFEAVDLETLQHIQEEASHAFLLKQLAVQLEPSTPLWARSRMSEIGWGYFKRVDAEVSALLPHDKKALAYPLVSFIVEERVMRLYPAYRNATQNANVRSVLNLILSQEGRHETRFERWVKKDLPFEIITRARAVEEQSWNEFCSQVEKLV